MWFKSALNYKKIAISLVSQYEELTHELIDPEPRIFLVLFFELMFSQIGISKSNPDIYDQLDFVLKKDFTNGDKSLFLDYFWARMQGEDVVISQFDFYSLFGLLLVIYDRNKSDCLKALNEAALI